MYSHNHVVMSKRRSLCLEKVCYQKLRTGIKIMAGYRRNDCKMLTMLAVVPCVHIETVVHRTGHRLLQIHATLSTVTLATVKQTSNSSSKSPFVHESTQGDTAAGCGRKNETDTTGSMIGSWGFHICCYPKTKKSVVSILIILWNTDKLHYHIV